MYNVLIADDEPAICIGLTSIIDWNSLGFRVAGTAEDGEEALEKLKAGNYDVLLTDIRMPVIDGLELIRELRSFNKSIKIIVISGYNDFDFAKKAIRYGVDGYLLKPVERKELMQYITKIKDALDYEQRSRKLYRDTAGIVKDRFLYSLVTGLITDYSQNEMIKHYGIAFPHRFFKVALLNVAGLHEMIEENPDEANLIIFSIRNISEEVMENHRIHGYVFEEKDEGIGILFNGDEQSLAGHRLSGMLNYIRFCMMKYFGIEIMIGLSEIVSALPELKTAYRQAGQALDRGTLTEKSAVIAFDNTYTHVNQSLDWDVKNLIRHIEELEYDKIEDEIEKLADEIVKKHIPQDTVKALLYNIMFEIGAAKSKYTNNAGNMLSFILEEIDTFEINRFSVRQFKEMLMRMCRDSCLFFEELYQSKQLSIINKIVNYINEHYSEKISLKTLAAKFYMNPIYLGRLFSKTMGVSFNDYLNRLRINEAKRLLAHSNQKITDIIKNLGYQNNEYFYKIFPRYEGVTFAEYREALEKKKKSLKNRS